jgi:hypothetical protein
MDPRRKGYAPTLGDGVSMKKIMTSKNMTAIMARRHNNAISTGSCWID